MHNSKLIFITSSLVFTEGRHIINLTVVILIKIVIILIFAILVPHVAVILTLYQFKFVSTFLTYKEVTNFTSCMNIISNQNTNKTHFPTM